MDLTSPWLQPRRFTEAAFVRYREEVIFRGFKWDPQVGDEGTVGDFALVLKSSALNELRTLAQHLDQELDRAERALWGQPESFAQLGLKGVLGRRLRALAKQYSWRDDLRLRRYDFHWSSEGWRISEVNADVPGGFAEASFLSPLALAAGLPGRAPEAFLENLGMALEKRLPLGAEIALVYATAYADDFQVMAAVAETLRSRGFQVSGVGPDGLTWKSGAGNRRALVQGRPVAAILRFFPVEWLAELGSSYPWENYLIEREGGPLLLNPGWAALSQSKRAPLQWAGINESMPTWNKLLPESRPPRFWDGDPNWLHKPAFGRVGERIVTRRWSASKIWRKAQWNILRAPRQWVRQKCFAVTSVSVIDQEYFPCLGVFVLGGKMAGLYARVGRHPLIDKKAREVPLLLDDKEKNFRQGGPTLFD